VPFLGGVIFGLAAVLLICLVSTVNIWWERKIAGRVHLRYGPQTTGPLGLMQPLADMLKLLFKEDITPAASDRMVFRMAPLLVFAPVAMSMVVIPFALGWTALDSSVGILFFLAVPSLSVLGILLGGWSSRNSYATIGGIRGAAQMISYEVPRSLSILAVVIVAGSIRPSQVLEAWQWWWIPLLAIAFVVFIIASIAETNRAPFDLAEAESELVAGYITDYSGFRMAVFVLTEYGGILTTALFASAVFFGAGFRLGGLVGAIALVATAFVLMSFILWVGWVFPRPRADQLMSFCWKVLTPMALVQLVIVGVVVPWLR